jgi:hypothetical protein
LTEVDLVEAGGLVSTNLGQPPSDTHTEGSGTYVLKFTGSPDLTACAIVAGPNETTPQRTVQAKATGEHVITVKTYVVGSGLSDGSFSLMVTCVEGSG